MAQSPISSTQLQKVTFPATLPMTYLHLNSGPEKPLLVFFHGYSDNALAVVRRAFPQADSHFEILAPNGPFPVPVRHGEGWKQAFAWYFADYSKKEELIPPQVAVALVEQLIAELNLIDRPKILIGFSQGGFFLPFVWPKLKNVLKMYAIGAAFRPDDYSDDMKIPVDALHGDQDEIISLQRSKESFAALKLKNPRGQFHEFQGLGHTMNDASRALLATEIDRVFGKV